MLKLSGQAYLGSFSQIPKFYSTKRHQNSEIIQEIIGQLDFWEEEKLESFRLKHPKIYYHLEEFALKSKNDAPAVFESMTHIEQFLVLFPWKIDDIIELWYSFGENVDIFLATIFPMTLHNWIEYNSTIMLFKKLPLFIKKLPQELLDSLSDIEFLDRLVSQLDGLSESDMDLLILKYSLARKANLKLTEIGYQISPIPISRSNERDKKDPNLLPFLPNFSIQQLVNIADIIERVEIYLEEHIDENDLQYYFHTRSYTTNMQGLFSLMWSAFTRLDRHIQDWLVLRVINVILERKYHILKLSGKQKSAKELIEMCTWISWFVGDIEVSFNNYSITFFVSEDEDYKKIWHKNSWWVFLPWSRIRWTEKTLIVLRGSDNALDTNRLLNVISHEWQHAKNTIVMPDYWSTDLLWLAKDEIIAFMADWTEWEKILKYLTMQSRNNGLYDYLRNLEKENKDLYEEKWTQYRSDLVNAIAIAEKFRYIQVSNYLNLLAIVPIREWWELYRMYFR
jgi:hypothetical protein